MVELRELREYARTPMIIKGIMTADAARKAVDAGSDACLICRPVLISYYGGGQEGIECYLDKLREELVDAMYMCGARKIADITLKMIRCSKW